MIDVTLLGTAALMPLPERALSSVFLSCGGHSILFDCGEGTQSAARKWGVSLMKTDIIALTHYHGDHYFGLPGLLQTMNSMNREIPLTITGPMGLREAMAPILALTGWVQYPIRLLELPANGIDLSEFYPGARLTPIPTDHRVSSQGYVFTLSRPGKFQPEKARALGLPYRLWGLLQKGQTVRWEGKDYTPSQVLGEPRRGLKVVFTGDTAYCKSLVEASGEADLLICDATYAEPHQAELAIQHGHMNFAQAACLAAEARVRRLWLTHFSQMIQEPEEALPNAAVVFPDAQCGQDGMTIQLRFENI